VPLKFTNGEETPLNSGALTQLVDVDHLLKLFGIYLFKPA